MFLDRRKTLLKERLNLFGELEGELSKRRGQVYMSQLVLKE